MKVQLKNVVANPFRDIDSYPIDKSKVTALKKSIKETTFWDNLVARRKNGKVEIAYGHHRLHALKELYPGTHEISLITRPLNDAEMIKIMANENMEEWGHDAGIMHETVKAIVHAYADDRIALKKPPSKSGGTKMRYAPSFCQGRSSSTVDDHPYTADSVAGFLGWGSTDVKYALRALCLIEEGHATTRDFQGITMAESRTVVEEITKSVRELDYAKKAARRESPAKAKSMVEQAQNRVSRVRQAVSNTLQSGGSRREAKEAALATKAKGQRKLPEIGKFALSLATKFRNFLDPDGETGHRLSEVIKYKKHLSTAEKEELVASLIELEEWAAHFRSELK